MRGTFKAFLLLCVTCILFTPLRALTYHNSEIGLSITYPDAWQDARELLLPEVLSSAPGAKEFPEEAVETAIEVAPYYDLFVTRTPSGDASRGNPSIQVLIMPLEEEEVAALGVEAIFNGQMADVLETLPGTTATLGHFPLPACPDIHHFFCEIPLKGRTLRQYHYAFWHPPQWVQVVFGFFDAEDEEEIKEIIRTMRIERPLEYGSRGS